MLFDNNDDLDSVDLREFLPTCGWGNIIVTSRNRMVLGYISGAEIDVPMIGKESGLELLLKGVNKPPESLPEAGVSSLLLHNQLWIFEGLTTLKPLRQQKRLWQSWAITACDRTGCGLYPNYLE
jgi:hypothetical protein